MGMETLDEFNSAYLDLGIEPDQGDFCFIERGMGGDVYWEMEDGGIKITYTATGDIYYGTFFWDSESARRYLCIPFVGCNLWLSDDRTIVSDSSGYEGGPVLTDTLALAAIQNYCYESNASLEDIVNGGEYSVNWIVETSDEEQIVVLFQSYTGAYERYYIDRATGETYITEFAPMIMTEEALKDETINVWNYID